jgi:hypothetical protein
MGRKKKSALVRQLEQAVTEREEAIRTLIQENRNLTVQGESLLKYKDDASTQISLLINDANTLLTIVKGLRAELAIIKGEKEQFT